MFCSIRAGPGMTLELCTLGPGERPIMYYIHRAQGQEKVSKNTLLDVCMI